VLLALALASPGVGAALYKCAIDGKTTYQDRPCGEEVARRGLLATFGPAGAMAIDPRSAQSRSTESREKQVLETLARDAFSALRAGELGRYMGYLCPRSREAFRGRGYPAVLAAEGQGYASRRTELLDATQSNRAGVTFLARDTAGAPAGAASGDRVVTAQFEWSDAGPCVVGIDSRTRTRGPSQ
jgi:hypothetical protein